MSHHERVQDVDRGLDISHYRRFLTCEEERRLFDAVKELEWYRVKYCSERHQNECTTPCWTNMYGGFPEIDPYQPIPVVLQDICDRLESLTGAKFNAILTRLYFDGKDNIAWHTDGRIFLGPEPVIASLSLGATSKFQLRRMIDVWPTASTPHGGLDLSTPERELTLQGGDLLIMRGPTQRHWHHRVPQERRRNQPRININFRYILPERTETAIKGVRAFYKYVKMCI